MSNYQIIYNRLRKAGLTEAVAVGFLGNWQAESGCEPNRLQNDFGSFRTISKNYTASVINGSISRNQFGADEKGYGLAQWTYVNKSSMQGRKFDLYDFWKKSGKALDDVSMQVDFALWELHHGYVHVLNELKNCTDIYKATDTICRKFEQPFYNNVDVRYQNAMTIRRQLDLDSWQNEEPESTAEASELTQNENVSTSWEKIPATEYWPCRGMTGGREDPGLCVGMQGPDVEVVQSILKARAFIATNPDGIFGSYLKEVVMIFQDAYGLDADGIIGPKTWAKLLER